MWTTMKVNKVEVDVKDMGRFHRACLEGSIRPEDLKEMMNDGGVDANEPDPQYGNAPIALATVDYHSKALGLVRLLLDAGANPNVTYHDPSFRNMRCPDHGSTPLHFCAGNSPDNRHYRVNADVVQLLLRRGAHAHVVNARTGKTPLHGAMARCDFNDVAVSERIVDLLLEHGAGVNARDRKGRTPLVDCLYPENGYGTFQLHPSQKVSLESPTVARILIDAGADLERESCEGDADDRKVTQCVDLALDSWLGDPDELGVAGERLTEVLEFLTQVAPAMRRRSIAEGNRYGSDYSDMVVGGTFLHRVLRCYDGGIDNNIEDGIFVDHVDPCIERFPGGGDEDVLAYVDPETGYTAVHQLILNDRMKEDELFDPFNDFGLDGYIAQTLQGLHDRSAARAATDGSAGQVLNLNAASSKYGFTPLHYAVQKGYKKTILKLVELGADVTARTKINGWTPLHMAAASKYPASDSIKLEENCERQPLDLEVIQTVVACGASVDAVTSNCEENVLHLLCKADRNTSDKEQTKALLDVVKWILEQDGCDPSVEDTSGKTATQWAVLTNKPTEVVHLLLNRDPSTLLQAQADDGERSAKRGKVNDH